MNNFIISESAIKRINFLNSNQSEIQMLKIKVEGGGCNGLKYTIAFTAHKSINDLVFINDGAIILIDKISIDYLDNSVLEYVEDLGSASFMIKNPNSKSKCGCGSSFSF